MGGLIFLIPLVIVIGIFMDIPKFKSLLLPLGVVVSCGILGGFDDLLSTVVRNRGGLAARFKMAWLLIIAIITAVILYLPKPWGLDHHWLFLPFYRDPSTRFGGIDIGIWFIPVAIIVDESRFILGGLGGSEAGEPAAGGRDVLSDEAAERTRRGKEPALVGVAVILAAEHEARRQELHDIVVSVEQVVRIMRRG